MLPPFDSKEFTQPELVDAELRRVTQICHDCRRCFNLCPSFPALLDAVDREDVHIERITQADFDRVVDLCYQCKLCYDHCPYRPPHEWDLDFPRLMLRAKAARVAREGVTRQDRFLGNPDRLGKLGTALPGLVNWANRARPLRVLLEKAAGVHRDRVLPAFRSPSFARWWKKNRAVAPSAGAERTVTLFYTCSVNYNGPEVGVAAVEVLERSRCAVSCPEQVCCGMPFLDGGDLARARENARQNLVALDAAAARGEDIVVPGPTCSYTIKEEWPRLVPSDAAERVRQRTFDLCEYLVRLAAEKRLDRSFASSPGTIAYHLPCHLKAQRIGFKSRDLLRLTGAKVEMVERCSGMDGTWGMKKEFHEESLKIAGRLGRELEAAEPDAIATDCPLAAMQIEAATGRRALHPIQIVRAAYEPAPGNAGP
jgi:glycerol-3-phosphate dehydrogenase subunit C